MQKTAHFTLKQVTDSIRKTIAERYARTYWVTAEMHKLNATRKGHCYPELVQKEDGQILVEIRGTIWKQQFERIQQRFAEIVKEPLRDGMELLFLVKITYHPIYNIGLEILDIDPNYTLGALQRERQETLERLTKEGILNLNQQLNMALVPKRLAIISQADSKGYSDFVTLLNGHPKKYRFNTFLFEATLQGDAAIASIQAQLKRIESIQHHFDAVVLIRGGGGEVGMHCYNNFSLAKAIALFPLPVLTGIGHSTNLTVCEMIAFRNGITPSDMAYFLLSIFEELDQPIDAILNRLPALMDLYIHQKNQVFTYSISALNQLVNNQLSHRKTLFQQQTHEFELTLKKAIFRSEQQLDDNRKQLRLTLQHRFETTKGEQEHAKNVLSIHAKNSITTAAQNLHQFAERLTILPYRALIQNQQNLSFLERSIHLVDPIHVLKRGYAIVTNQQGVVNASNCAKAGQIIIIQTADIELKAKVEKVNKTIKNNEQDDDLRKSI